MGMADHAQSTLNYYLIHNCAWSEVKYRYGKQDISILFRYVLLTLNDPNWIQRRRKLANIRETGWQSNIRHKINTYAQALPNI